jgi:hypothetical protein
VLPADGASGAGAGARGVGGAWQVRELQGKSVGVHVALEDTLRQARLAWQGTQMPRMVEHHAFRPARCHLFYFICPCLTAKTSKILN